MRYKNIYEAQNYDYIRDPANRWLAKYTYENLDKWPRPEILKTLIERYPVSELTHIFRGINFTDKEEFLEFYENIKDGIFEINSISSWAKSYEGAYQFAVTQPTYFLSRELMQREDEKSKNRELLSGYRGVIIELMVQPNEAIDVDKSGLGHESEIILPPGKYQILKFHQIKKFADRINDKDVKIEKFILSLSKPIKNEENHQFFNYIMHHHKDKLSKKAREKVFEILYFKPVVKKQEDYMLRMGRNFDKKEFYQIFFHPYLNKLISENYFSESLSIQYKQDIKKLFENIKKIWKQDPMIEVRGLFGLIKYLSKNPEFTDLVNYYDQHLKSFLGKQYKELERKGRDINKLPPEERRDAIRRHQEELTDFFNKNLN